MGLEPGIWASRLGFGPQGWNLGLKTGIFTSRLEFRPQDWDLRGGTKKEKEEEEKEKFPICVDRSPFRAATQK